MTEDLSQAIADEAKLAIAHTAQPRRMALTMFFELDLRLARIVSATTEPMLGQMRLAWWRDMLGSDADEWPRGDAVLDGIRTSWAPHHGALARLVDGWEHLLADPPLNASDARAFAKGRSDALIAVFGAEDNAAPALFDYAWHWALADLAAKVSLDEERTMLVDLALEVPKPSDRVPRSAKGLAILGALGLRSLKRGGRPLMDGRGAALVAARAAITGR